MLYHADFFNDQPRVVFEFNLGSGLEAKSRVHDRLKLNGTGTVSYTHLTLPTTPYV